jgi:lipopolysaccharide heptosyltransferase II
MPKDQSPIDWGSVERVLVIRLRSIGDTVLSTPSIIALKRFLPEATVEVLLEDWVAPLLEGSGIADSVIGIGKSGATRLATAWKLNRKKYDVVIDLHGGTTAAQLARATGARYRVGYSHYRLSFVYSHLLSSSADYWGKSPTHSAEQQLALLGFIGVPVDDRPKSFLKVSEQVRSSLRAKFPLDNDFALIHPASLFHTKQWAAEGFAAVIEMLAEKGIESIAVASSKERSVLEKLKSSTNSPLTVADDLSLPEITALASEASIFVGNDSGLAHIAAAVGTPAVVIFGSSNRDHWRPWTDAPNEIVFNPFDCQPCPGYECKVYGDPKCIKSVTVDVVLAAVDRLLGNRVIAGGVGRKHGLEPLV